MSETDLEALYADARAALKAKDFDRASGLLRQVLAEDENYKDASKLLAQAVHLKRRRWYNDARILAAAGLLILAGLGMYLVPRLMSMVGRPAKPVPPASTPTPGAEPNTAPSPEPTSIPLVWERVSMGQEFARDTVEGFLIDDDDPEVLYVRMQSAGFFRSIDGGASWGPVGKSELPPRVLSDLVKSLGSYNLDGLEPHTAVQNPDGESWKYRMSPRSSWEVLEPGGSTWRGIVFVGRPFSAAIAFDGAGNVYVQCDAYRTEYGHELCRYRRDGTGQRVLGDAGVGALTFIVVPEGTPDLIYVAGQGVAVSRDGGKSWNSLNNGLGSTVLQLYITHGEEPILFVQPGDCQVGDQGEIGFPLFRSMDGGRTWKSTIDTGCYLIQDADGESMYRIGRHVPYYEAGWTWWSHDGGQTWHKRRGPPVMRSLVADPGQPGKLYLYGGGRFDEASGSHQAEYYVSTDNGLTWVLQERNPIPRPCYGSTPRFLGRQRPGSIDPADGRHVLYVENGELMESVDDCESTRLFPSPPPGRQYTIAFDAASPSTLYAGGADGAFVSFDAGLTWGQINEGLLGVTTVYSIVSDDAGNIYAATPYGIFLLEGDG